MNDQKTFDDDLKRLKQAVLSLEDETECGAFFEDILTIQEMHAIAQRLKVAKLLSEGMTCQHIAEQTGASTATISRVNRCLNYGPGGYNTVLDRITEEE